MRARRTAVLLATVLLALLALAGAAAAAPGPRLSRPFSRAQTLLAQRAFWKAPPQAAQTVDPVGPFVLSGTVLDYDGNPASEAEVFWGWLEEPGSSWWEGIDHTGGRTTTGADGAFQFPAVTSVPGDDWLETVTWDETGFWALDSWDNDFSAQQPYVVRPGRVRVETQGESGGAYVLARVGDEASSAAMSEFQRVSASFLADVVAPGFVTAELQAEDFRGAVTRAVGWVSPGYTPVPVTAGQEAPVTLRFDWDDAVRGRLAGRMCTRSGPPGSHVTFVLDHWPAGTQVSFRGFEFATGTTDWFSPVVTPAGRDQTYRVRLAVPKDAAPGDIYCFEAYRSDDPRALLDVYDYFQVCDFGASSPAIERGQPVRLHGRVLGDRVTLFKRTSPAPQPARLSAPGWTKVRSFRTYGSGRFHTGFMKPGTTTWYVVRYDSGVFPAFTQVIKVKVRND